MHIFGLGNPLLDITAKVDDEFLEKYNLPKNSAILAEPKHETMYDEVINKYEIEYSAGGATQNTMRFCQWVVGKNNQVTTFLGAVGNDYFGKIMEKKAKGDGVTVRYHYVEGEDDMTRRHEGRTDGNLACFAARLLQLREFGLSKQG